ncbi:MAG: hypothetical protein FWF12_00650 [Betaproteobacteria bacterium]|nr:hypothetical protein [Betaproteobacteria bacterium]
MDQAEFEQVKATFPWGERVFQTTHGGIVQVVDRNGREVPLFTMTRFLKMITEKLAAKVGDEQKEAA